MKKRIFWTAATVGVLLAGWFVDPMGAATKTAAYLETAQTFTALKSFSAGLAVNAGQCVGFEGSAGDTCIKRETDTGFVSVYVDGSLRATITPRGVIPGACGSNPYAMELGSTCRDYSQDEPRLLQKTMTGIVEVQQ